MVARWVQRAELQTRTSTSRESAASSASSLPSIHFHPFEHRDEGQVRAIDINHLPASLRMPRLRCGASRTRPQVEAAAPQVRAMGPRRTQGREEEKGRGRGGGSGSSPLRLLRVFFLAQVG